MPVKWLKIKEILYKYEREAALGRPEAWHMIFNRVACNNVLNKLQKY